MKRIRSKNTSPEIKVRRLLLGMGYRYRLHAKNLPGTPDIAFPGKKKVIFIHGCFWHRHHDCRKATTPSSNKAYWEEKFARTVQRDAEVQHALLNDGWRVLVIWECQISANNRQALEVQIRSFLDR